MNLHYSLSAMVALVAMSLGGLIVQHTGIRVLREELAAARLKNEAWRQSHSGGAAQISKMPRDSILRDPSPAFVSVEAEPRTAGIELPWKDKGSDSPESTLETAMWAASRGDVEAFARLLIFEPKAREIAASLRRNLSDENRARFPTDESLVALLLVRQAPLEGIEVTGRSDVADGGVLLHVAMVGPGGTSKQADFAFVSGSEGWRLVVTLELVSHAAHLLKR